MRLRIAMLACALSALVAGLGPSAAGAAPHANQGLTIRAVPHSIIAGEAVLIYGRLAGADHANQVIRLYHRIDPRPFFSLIGVTTTDSQGLYEFTRAEGIVDTNRSWFVRGPGDTHSRTVHEQVSALISLAASSTNGTTRHPLVFSGHVTPNHAGNHVLLQVNNGNGDAWRTVTTGRVGPDSNYAIPAAWRTPGERDVRVVLPADPRNVRSASDPVSVIIQQTEHPDFTINTSDPIVANNSPYTISGTLDQPGTTTPEPNTSVSLFARVPGTPGSKLVATGLTDGSGNYSFGPMTSQTNQLYQARATFAPHRDGSAVLFEGVQDVVTMSASSSTSTVGGQVTFSGSVAPDKAGHVIYLQRLGADGDWHTVDARTVAPGSTFSFGWTFGTAGTKQFRARILGGPVNVGAASSPVTVEVMQPPVSSLPSTG